MVLYKIEHVENKGRCLAADADIRAGDAVLACEPYEATLDDAEVSKRSHLTFKSLQRPLRCGQCKFARYASREEQQRAWKQGHKEECKALQRLTPRVPGPTVRLMARVLWKSIRTEEACPELGGSFEDLQSLMDHWDETDDARKLMYAQAATVTRKFMDPDELLQGDLPDTKQIARLLAALACNSHTICDQEERAIGIGIYPLGALVNHSCTPNLAQSFQGRRIVFRALHDIPTGEEATISYIELAQTRHERRIALLERYYFDIDLDKSKGHWNASKPVHVSDKLDADSCTMPTIIRIWREPPWPMDKADEMLMGLYHCTSNGQPSELLKDSGFMAKIETNEPSHDARYLHDLEFNSLKGNVEVEEEEAAADEEGDPSGAGESLNMSEDEASNLDSPDSRYSLGLGLNPLLKKKAGKLPKVLIMDCWGPQFFAGNEIDWRQVNFLACLGDKWAGAFLSAWDCLTASPVTAGGLVDQAWAYQQEAVEQGTLDPGVRPVVPGPRHILRNRMLEVGFKAKQAAGIWDAALKDALALRAFYSVVYPEVFPVRALHEVAIAKIAGLLEQTTVSAQALVLAVSQLQVLQPEGDFLQQMRQQMHDERQY